MRPQTYLHLGGLGFITMIRSNSGQNQDAVNILYKMTLWPWSLPLEQRRGGYEQAVHKETHPAQEDRQCWHPTHINQANQIHNSAGLKATGSIIILYHQLPMCFAFRRSEVFRHWEELGTKCWGRFSDGAHKGRQPLAPARVRAGTRSTVLEKGPQQFLFSYLHHLNRNTVNGVKLKW